MMVGGAVGRSGFAAILLMCAASGSAGAATLTTLVAFDGTNGPDQFALTADAAGDLFGNSLRGGGSSIYEVLKTVSGYGGITTVASFDVVSRGLGGLTVDAAGNLFGNDYGGPYGRVFEIAKTGSGYGSVTTLALPDATIGFVGFTGLTADAAGNLFGLGARAVFEIPKTASGYGSITRLASLSGNNPVDRPIADAAGNLFIASNGGAAAYWGSVLEVAKTGSGYADATVLGRFNYLNGALPRGPLAADRAGNLFGTTQTGGQFNYGTVFEIPKIGTGFGNLITLVEFDGTNGAHPLGGVITDAAGNLFGTTSGFETSNVYFSDGTVFEIPNTRSGYGSVETLVSFNGANGSAPKAGLIADAAGSLYGTTSSGGGGPSSPLYAFGSGSVFQITDAGFITNLAMDVPEPSSLALLGTGVLVLAMTARANRRHPPVPRSLD